MEIRRIVSTSDSPSLRTTASSILRRITPRWMGLILAVGAMTAAACAVHAQTSPAAVKFNPETQGALPPNASSAFEVATIRRSDPNSARNGFPTDGRHVACFGTTVKIILSVAYGIHVKQIVNGPDWISKDAYDVNGISDRPGEPSLAQMQQMYRKLLADRFHLVVHREVRDLPIYAVRIVRGGPHLSLAKPGEDLSTSNRQNGGQRTLKFINMPMSAFALNMNFYMERPVVDQTSLDGAYDFTLAWTFDDSKPASGDAAPSLFTALKEQLGLRFEAVTGAAEVFVIDRIERPSEN